METTMEFSFSNIRSKLAMIDFFELVGFGFAVWCLGAVAAIGKPGESFSDLISFLIGLEGILLGSWASYNGQDLRSSQSMGKGTKSRLRLEDEIINRASTYTLE
ncbi:MAG: hypothetical protein WBL25_15170 [Anaerolineales bacterium]